MRQKPISSDSIFKELAQTIESSGYKSGDDSLNCSIDTVWTAILVIDRMKDDLEAAKRMKWPNLDCMMKEDLTNFLEQARFMVKYASQKIVAMEYRESGQIELALSSEDRCEQLYKQLPP